MNFIFENSWKIALQKEFEKPYFQQLVTFLTEEYNDNSRNIFPPSPLIFKAFEACSTDEVKVVILGQDPYPTSGHANGLCFSINPAVTPFAKSLINIFKEIEVDLGKPFPQNGDLSRWAEQGVLLLNSILTVREGAPQSHQGKGWEQFTDAVIQFISNEKEGVVFLLWGASARKKGQNIDRTKHLVLEAGHPSPMSANRGLWFGNKHFSIANTYLESKSKSTIDW
ncbi:MAG: uracil-DNA glycosylase [Bacteroidota bacterium]